jgi:acetylornithine deacetylase/succinyl-diaminopimelate desuccinylase-like protein
MNDARVPKLARLEPVERLLCELIALPSVNPGFLAPGAPEGGEARVAEFIAATAARQGLDVALTEVVPGRSNVSVRLEPRGRPKRRILFAPHLDTVGGPGEWEVLFAPRKRGDRIHGRGACDTKGSAAAMLTVFLELARKGPRPGSTELVFVGLVDEEKDQAGSRALAQSGWDADLAIVGEPTQLRVVTAHKGDVWLYLETVGRAAHGATPHRGANAITAMARVVALLAGEYAAALRQRTHALLGQPTVNVGTIRGGNQPNIVPDHCEISIDRRTLPGETEASVRREIRALARRHGLQLGIKPGRKSPCLALETSPAIPLVRQFLRAVGQPESLGVDYFCDAAVLSAGGIPSVVFGPGDIAQAHTADEWVLGADLGAAVALLRRFVGTLP